MRWWCECLNPPIGERSIMPRTDGITMVMDKGMGLNALDDLLRVCGEYIDILKMTAGTALLCEQSLVQEKIQRLKDRKVDVMLGGTLAEIAIDQKNYMEYLKFSKSLGCTVIEVADGSIVLPLQERRGAVQKALDMGFRVITEVGKEDPDEMLSIEETSSIISWDVESGANLINLEAREFGNVGIYQEDGSIREDMLAAIQKAVPDESSLLWEAPLFAQQLDLIRRLGNGVNLGNIQPSDVLRLETIRRGLIGDTFRDTLRKA